MRKWISQDPLGELDGPNLYAYVHNSPTNAFDRFGLATDSTAEDRFNLYFFGDEEPYCPKKICNPYRRGGDMAEASGAQLPMLRHAKHEEELFPNPAKVFDLGLQDKDDLGIGFVNGICTTEERAMDCALHISRLAEGLNVHAVLNPTHGFTTDIAESKIGLNYIVTNPVFQIHAMWNSFFEKSSATAKFLMVCHSQGAIHVRNALLCYPPELRNRIMVVAIAPAAYIYQESCAKVIHYRAHAWRDFVPRIDRAGAERSKKTIITLESHTDAPWFDHDFMSPTYKRRLQRHLTKYIPVPVQGRPIGLN